MTQGIKIPLEEVTSSTISAIGYDVDKRLLAIRFTSKGQVRHYAGVSADVAMDFYTSASKGQFFNASIKGKYQVEPMTGDCPKCGAHGWIGDTCSDCGCAEHAAPVRPILHFVFADEPSATSTKSQKAACGAWVDPKTVARVLPVTCEKCKAAQAAYDGMAF